jgi:PAS domain S-box-containing protein
MGNIVISLNVARRDGGDHSRKSARMPGQATLETYRHIFDNVNDAIFVHDLKGRFLDVNQIACQRLGYTREELLQMSVQQIDAPEFAPNFAKSIPTLVEKKSVVAETCHVAKDGRKIPSEVSARFIDYQGQQAVLSVVRDISDRKLAEAKISELQDQLRDMAIRAERERLGRELHDGIGQVLGFIGLKAATIGELVRQHQDKAVESAAAELAQVAQTAYADVREEILGLRESPTPGGSLESTLREYLRRYQRDWNIAVELVVGNDVTARYTPAAEIQLLRIIQEALTNVRQHAQTQAAAVKFEKQGEHTVVIIQDSGAGFNPTKSKPDHFGLQTMRERAESFGGRLEIASAPGAGTSIIVHLPPEAQRSAE